MEFWSLLSTANMVSDPGYIENYAFAAWFSREFTLYPESPPIPEVAWQSLHKREIQEIWSLCEANSNGWFGTNKFPMNFSSKLRNLLSHGWHSIMKWKVTACSSQWFQTGSLPGNVKNIMVKDLVSGCCTVSDSQNHILVKHSFSGDEHWNPYPHMLGGGMAPACCFWGTDLEKWSEGIPSR